MKKHEKIRTILKELAEINGFVINPICLQDYILVYLNNKNPNNKTNATKAKNASLIFAVLCNEYYLISEKLGRAKEFYMTHDRWLKYNIKQRMIETATEILKDMKLISWRYEKICNSAYAYYKLYKISTKRLNEIKYEILEC